MCPMGDGSLRSSLWTVPRSSSLTRPSAWVTLVLVLLLLGPPWVLLKVFFSCPPWKLGHGKVMGRGFLLRGSTCLVSRAGGSFHQAGSALGGWH